MSLRREARRAAQRYGLPPEVFERQVAAESGFDPNARSPAGAIGVAQIMPATARGWGVDPTDPVASLDAAARAMASYTRKYGSLATALAAYNAGPGAVQKYGGIPPYKETQNYVKKVLGGLKGSQQSLDLGGEVPTPAAAALQRTPAPAPPPVSAPADPSFSARANLALPEGYQDPPSSPPALPIQRSLASTTTGQPTPGFSLPAGNSKGKVVIAPDADRPGAKLNPQVVSFVSQISAISGKPLVIGTGTRHSQRTVSGKVSDHWHGNAADIPASGKGLIRIGQAALIAAGADPAWARKQRGGLYNIGGRQIIFNTSGKGVGDHTGHLHVSGRRR